MRGADDLHRPGHPVNTPKEFHPREGLLSALCAVLLPWSLPEIRAFFSRDVLERFRDMMKPLLPSETASIPQDKILLFLVLSFPSFHL